VLNLLKQICDHPALALGKLASWEEHESRKWDLFKELLDESLGSGQKVVVFTQYLGMIYIMQQYLKSLGVQYATLTGSTRKRGDVVDRFNEDPKCRVFLGSLRAGGTGIDLVAGSVVIHYDRWWNAAKEDQATDRVYRIGQRRAVQVFKLLAENTLEERIAAMIDRKRQLLGDVVQADHPRLGKIFSPEELLELLQQIE
jgi:SNF2 family DNA or RNA helicase